MAKKILAFLCLFAAVHFGPVSPAVPANDKADIEGVVIRPERGNLEVSFRVSNCFTPTMEEAVLSGVTTTFRMLVVLEKSGYALIQPAVVEVILAHSVKYDLLKKEFRVELPEHPDKVCYTKDFEEARHLMSTVRDLPVMPLHRLKKDQQYRLLLKAELSKLKLPLFLRYIIFFVSLWDFETDWRETPFSL
jgi:hypothetical protein